MAGISVLPVAAEETKRNIFCGYCLKSLNGYRGANYCPWCGHKLHHLSWKAAYNNQEELSAQKIHKVKDLHNILVHIGVKCKCGIYQEYYFLEDSYKHLDSVICDICGAYNKILKV